MTSAGQGIAQNFGSAFNYIRLLNRRFGELNENLCGMQNTNASNGIVRLTSLVMPSKRLLGFFLSSSQTNPTRSPTKSVQDCFKTAGQASSATLDGGDERYK